MQAFRDSHISNGAIRQVEIHGFSLCDCPGLQQQPIVIFPFPLRKGHEAKIHLLPQAEPAQGLAILTAYQQNTTFRTLEQNSLTC